MVIFACKYWMNRTRGDVFKCLQCHMSFVYQLMKHPKRLQYHFWKILWSMKGLWQNQSQSLEWSIWPEHRYPWWHNLQERQYGSFVLPLKNKWKGEKLLVNIELTIRCIWWWCPLRVIMSHFTFVYQLMKHPKQLRCHFQTTLLSKNGQWQNLSQNLEWSIWSVHRCPWWQTLL